MIVKRIIYFLIICLLMILLLLSGAYYLLVILAVFVSVSFISWLAMHAHCRFVKVDVVKEENLYVKVSTHGWFPIGKIVGNVQVNNVFYGTNIESPLLIWLGQKEIETVIPYEYNKIGNTQVTIQIKKIIDLFGLFSKRINQEKEFNECVKPHQQFIDQNQILFGQYLNEVINDDYEIREFRDGDSIKDIHYKMSYKMKKRLIKEHLKNSGNTIRIYLDLSDESCEEIFAEFMEFMNYLVINHVKSEVFWISQTNLMSQKVITQTDLDTTITTILSHPKADSVQGLNVDFIISSQGILPKGGVLND